MRFFYQRNTTLWTILTISFCLVSLILWNTYIFFQIFKNEERLKMNLYAKAQRTLKNADENTDVDLPLYILSNNISIPIIVTENDSIIKTANIDDKIISNPNKARKYLTKLKNQNEPIVIVESSDKSQILYYDDSALFNQLKYYPIGFLLIIVLFASLVYNYYKSIKIASQNKLWAGMAKETAHQIGTPLSSLIGWVELIKTEGITGNLALEIEKDIERLETITDRFSKIGSDPKLEIKDIVSETLFSYDYLQSRSSKQIEFSHTTPQEKVHVELNPILHSWTIENIVKNAIDAMKGKGNLHLQIEEELETVKITIIDTGSGIPKKQFSKIFEPGFTTKKRGWGLGLSLTKRIVEDYHKGTIKVLQSEQGKGTSIQIIYSRYTKAQ